MVSGTGHFRFSGGTTLVVENAEQAKVVRNFINLFTKAAGFTPVLKTGEMKGDVRFVTDKSLKSEAYRLDIIPEQITVRASDVKGFSMPCRPSASCFLPILKIIIQSMHCGRFLV